ncbi:MAG: hypothetical protein WKF84_07470 [Pyrinomonadaceae bacterium]
MPTIFFGSAFGFRRSDVGQARSPFSQFREDPITGKSVPDTLRNQFGGSVGGRIIKDKLFFFTDYEGTRSKMAARACSPCQRLWRAPAIFSEYRDANGNSHPDLRSGYQRVLARRVI